MLSVKTLHIPRCPSNPELGLVSRGTQWVHSLIPAKQAMKIEKNYSH